MKSARVARAALQEVLWPWQEVGAVDGGRWAAAQLADDMRQSHARLGDVGVVAVVAGVVVAAVRAT